MANNERLALVLQRLPLLIGFISTGALAAPKATQADAFLQAGLPEGCAARIRPTPYKLENIQVVHDRKMPDTLPRLDIICFGSSITIDRPIRTNGGQVLIFTDRLALSNSIDTRPYFDRSIDTFFAKPTEIPGTPARSATMYDFYKGFPGDRWAMSAIASVVDYYTRCKDCITVTGIDYGPEFTGGLTPPVSFTGDYERMRAVSENQRIYVPESRQSGRITLIAGKISTRPEAFAKVDRSNPLDCATAAPEPMALIASGARGSRGGFGAETNLTIKFTTNEQPGDGGDAGSVSLLYWDPAAAQDMAALAILTDVRAGQSGPVERFDARVFDYDRRDVRKAVPSDVCSWRRLPDSGPGKDGLAGDVNTQSVTREQAFNLFNDKVRLLDSNGLYDDAAALDRLRVNKDIAFLTFSDFVAFRMLEEVRRAQQLVAKDLIRLIQTQAGPHSTLDRELSEWRMFDIGALAGDTPQSISEPILHLKSILFTPAVETGIVPSYLVGTRGLLNAPTGNYEDPTYQQRIIEILQKSGDTEAQILVGVYDLNLELARLRLSIERGQVEQKIRSIQTTIASISSAMPTDLTRLKEGSKKIKDRADTALNSYERMKKVASEDKVDTTKVALSMMGYYGAIFAVGTQIIEFALEMRQKREVPAELLKALDQLLVELKDLEREGKEQKHYLRSGKYDALYQLLEVRKDGRTDKLLRTRLFDQLFRRTILLHNLDNSRSHLTLLSNADQLLEFANGGPTRFSYDGTLNGHCMRIDPRSVRAFMVKDNCLYWPAPSTHRVAIGAIKGANRTGLAAVPLVVVAPGVEGYAGVPLFGLSLIDTAEIVFPRAVPSR